MKPYKVYGEIEGEGGEERDVIIFTCWADSAAHAVEQIENAYPNEVFEQIEARHLNCDKGGDADNRCAGCAYSGDFTFDLVGEECVRRR